MVKIPGSSSVPRLCHPCYPWAAGSRRPLIPSSIAGCKIWVCREGAGFDRPGRILVAATGVAQNKWAQVQHLPGDKITVEVHGGQDPELCEEVAAEIFLPVAVDRVRFYPLDESGNRRAAVPVEARAGKTLLRLGPQHRTVWYEVEVR